MTYLFAGRKVEIKAGQLSAFWAAIPHQLVAYEDAPDYFVATIPLAWFLQWKLPAPWVQALLQGELLSEKASALRDDRVTITRW